MQTGSCSETVLWSPPALRKIMTMVNKILVDTVVVAAKSYSDINHAILVATWYHSIF